MSDETAEQKAAREAEEARLKAEGGQGPTNPPEGNPGTPPEAKNGAWQSIKRGTVATLKFVSLAVMFLLGAAISFAVGYAAFVYGAMLMGTSFWATLGIMIAAFAVIGLLNGTIPVPQFFKNLGSKTKEAASKAKSKVEAGIDDIKPQGNTEAAS